MINSRQKGARGERAFAEFLREHGFTARRGQQYCGTPDSPDVVSNLPYAIEVKCVEKLNLRQAIAKAGTTFNGKPWIIAHKTNRSEWYVTLTAEEFLKLVKRVQGLEGVEAAAENW